MQDALGYLSSYSLPTVTTFQLSVDCLPITISPLTMEINMLNGNFLRIVCVVLNCHSPAFACFVIRRLYLSIFLPSYHQLVQFAPYSSVGEVE